MIHCELGDKKYTVDFISGRAYRELMDIQSIADKGRAQIRAAQAGDNDPIELKNEFTGADMDALVRWFCLLFGNQFTVDDVYDNYPVDDMKYDILYAMMAVEAGLTRTLVEFPLPTAAEAAEKQEPKRKPAKGKVSG